MDYKHLTAPCGLPCFECYAHKAIEHPEYRQMVAEFLGVPVEQAQCRGCRSEKGQIPHIPMPCRVYPCVEAKGLHNCSECDDFPCDQLHPYQDRNELWHNTKVFHLCTIKKMGLQKWAEEKAGSIADTYSNGKWTL